MDKIHTFGCPDMEYDYHEENIPVPQDTPLNMEIGREHYKNLYQPIVLMEKVGMYPCCANILKYVFRHKNKNGKQDLEKALHYCDLQASLGCHWYNGVDTSNEEFHKFIKMNFQLDKNQIRAIFAIQHHDFEMLKDAINNELLENYT